jgi:hypothetical protein
MLHAVKICQRHCIFFGRKSSVDVPFPVQFSPEDFQDHDVVLGYHRYKDFLPQGNEYFEETVAAFFEEKVTEHFRSRGLESLGNTELKICSTKNRIKTQAALRRMMKCLAS